MGLMRSLFLTILQLLIVFLFFSFESFHEKLINEVVDYILLLSR